jgi:uncharacterized protein YcnI
MAMVAAILAGGIATAAPAVAHVTVHPETEPAGASYSILTFRVPNEMDDARTVGLKVVLPTATPLIGISVRPVAGWHVRTRSVTLATPIETDDGALTTAVAEIIWSGGSIPVGGYQDFDVSVGHFPDEPGTLTFKALQRYSNGDVVRWIETAPAGSPEPQHPAPSVHLVTPEAAAVATGAGSSDGTDRALAIVALAVAVVALWLAVAGRVRRPPAAQD